MKCERCGKSDFTFVEAGETTYDMKIDDENKMIVIDTSSACSDVAERWFECDNCRLPLVLSEEHKIKLI